MLIPIHSMNSDTFYQTYKNLYNEIPPWIVNDIIGFFNIKFDGGIYFTCVTYMQRRFFRRKNHERIWIKFEKSKDKNEFLYFYEVPKINSNDYSNINEIIELFVNNGIEYIYKYTKKHAYANYDYLLIT